MRRRSGRRRGRISLMAGVLTVKAGRPLVVSFMDLRDSSPQPGPMGRRVEVGSLEECVDAILALGLPTTPTWVGETPLVPSGCSVREASLGYGEHLHWNSARAGAGREDLAPVCRVAA